MKLLLNLIICGSFFLTATPVLAEEPPLSILKAVTFAMANTPEVSLAKEDVNLKTAINEIDKGDQDPTVTLDFSYERDDEPLTPYEQSVYQKSAEKTKTLTSTLSAEKKLENGITFGPYISLERKEDDLIDDETDNKSEVKFEITIPLLELFDHQKKGQQPLPSYIDRQAAYRDLAHTVSKSAVDTASAFWNALAAQQLLVLYRESEKEAKTFFEEISLLVEKDEYPASDLGQAIVSWDEQVITRMEAEQTLFSTRQGLAVVMGIPVEQLLDFPDLLGEFPKVKKSIPDRESTILHALDNRMDLSAQKIRSTYYQSLVSDAKFDLLPELNLGLNAGYHGLVQDNTWGGYLESLHTNVPGPSYEIELSVTKILGNNAAKGEVSKNHSMFRQSKINESSIKRQIYSDVLTGRSNFENAISILEYQKNVVKRYRQSLEETKIKFKYRNATMSDLLDMKEDYRNSRISLLERKKAYAISIIEFRQACGSVLAGKDNHFTITRTNLLTPWQNPGQTPTID